MVINKEDFKNIAAGPVFAAITVLSLLFAYYSIKCHSYARAPFRFAVDMLLRTLFIALPFCLGLCSYGFFKKRPWADRCSIYAAVMFGLIMICLLIEITT